MLPSQCAAHFGSTFCCTPSFGVRRVAWIGPRRSRIKEKGRKARERELFFPSRYHLFPIFLSLFAVLFLFPFHSTFSLTSLLLSFSISPYPSPSLPPPFFLFLISSSLHLHPSFNSLKTMLFSFFVQIFLIVDFYAIFCEYKNIGKNKNRQHERQHACVSHFPFRFSSASTSFPISLSSSFPSSPSSSLFHSQA